MKTIAETMKEILIEQNIKYVTYGDLDNLHECAERCGIYDRCKTVQGQHPLNIISKVLNGLDKSELFEKSYIQFEGKLARCFKLK